MDVMQLRRGLMMGMASQMVGIKQAVTVGDGTKTISFPVNGKPYGYLISCDNDNGQASGATFKRAGGQWTDYQSGQYVGRVCIRRGNTPDFYNIPASSVTYDGTEGTFAITPTVDGVFENGVTYYMWYFTIPF